MKQFTLLLCNFLFLAVTLSAQQTAEGTPVVFSHTGQGKYLVNGSDTVTMTVLLPGQVIADNGLIVLMAGDTAGVFYNGVFAYLSGPAAYNAASISNTPGSERSTMAAVFGPKLYRASHGYFFDSGVVMGFGSGDEDPPSSPSGVGTGNKERKIIVVSPLDGRVASDMIVFKWVRRTGTDAIRTYKFSVFDSGGDEIFTREVRGTSLGLQATDIGLQADEAYTWSVTAVDEADLTTGEVILEYVGEQTYLRFQNLIKSDGLYRKADAEARQIIEASLWANFRFMQRAKITFDSAYGRYPENPLIGAMRESFYYYDAELPEDN